MANNTTPNDDFGSELWTASDGGTAARESLDDVELLSGDTRRKEASFLTTGGTAGGFASREDTFDLHHLEDAFESVSTKAGWYNCVAYAEKYIDSYFAVCKYPAMILHWAANTQSLKKYAFSEHKHLSAGHQRRPTNFSYTESTSCRRRTRRVKCD